MLISFDDYLHAEKLRHKLTLSQDIDDQRILQSDWTRCTSGHIQQKVVVLDPTFSL